MERDPLFALADGGGVDCCRLRRRQSAASSPPSPPQLTRTRRPAATRPSSTTRTYSITPPLQIGLTALAIARIRVRGSSLNCRVSRYYRRWLWWPRYAAPRPQRPSARSAPRLAPDEVLNLEDLRLSQNSMPMSARMGINFSPYASNCSRELQISLTRMSSADPNATWTSNPGGWGHIPRSICRRLSSYFSLAAFDGVKAHNDAHVESSTVGVEPTLLVISKCSMWGRDSTDGTDGTDASCRTQTPRLTRAANVTEPRGHARRYGPNLIRVPEPGPGKR